MLKLFYLSVIIKISFLKPLKLFVCSFDKQINIYFFTCIKTAEYCNIFMLLE